MKRFKPELKVLVDKIKEYQEFEDSFTGNEEIPDLNLGSLFSAIDDTTRTIKSAILDYEKEQVIKRRGALLNFWAQQEYRFEYLSEEVNSLFIDCSPDVIDNLEDEEMIEHSDNLEANLDSLIDNLSDIKMKLSEFKVKNQ